MLKSRLAKSSWNITEHVFILRIGQVMRVLTEPWCSCDGYLHCSSYAKNKHTFRYVSQTVGYLGL